MSEIVTIKPLPSKGRVQHGIYPNTRLVWGISRDKFNNRATGLTTEDEKELEVRMNLNPGELDKNSNFWIEYTVVLTDKEENLDLENPVDKLKYLVLRTKKLVANSRAEVKPHSLYYMYNEVKEAEKDAEQFDKQLLAYKYLADMSFEEQANFLKLFGFSTISMKPIIIKKKLKEIADDTKQIDRFISFYEDKDKAVKIMFEDLVQKKIVSVKNGAYYHGETMLGADLNLAIVNIKNPKKQDLLIVLKKQLEESK